MISFNIIPSDVKGTAIHLEATYIDKKGDKHTCEMHGSYGMSYRLIADQLAKLIISVSGGRDYPYRESKFSKVLFKRYSTYINFIADSEMARRYPAIAPIVYKWRSFPPYLRKDSERNRYLDAVIELVRICDWGEDIIYFVKDIYLLITISLWVSIVLKHAAQTCGPLLRNITQTPLGNYVIFS